MTEEQSADEIVLRVPAHAAYGRIVRVGAGSLARRHGMAFAAIEELLLAVDEAMILLIAARTADGGAPRDDASVSCVFRLDEQRVEMRAQRTDQATLEPESIARFESLAASLADQFDVDASGIRIVKRTRTR